MSLKPLMEQRPMEAVSSYILWANWDAEMGTASVRGFLLTNQAGRASGVQPTLRKKLFLQFSSTYRYTVMFWLFFSGCITNAKCV